MPPATRRSRTGAGTQTPVEQHAEWLNLLRPDGPFITVPVLTEVFGQGPDQVPTERRARLRQAWAEVTADPDTLNASWQTHVLTEVLGYRGGLLAEGAALPTLLGGGTPYAAGGDVLRPDAAVMGRGSAGDREPRLLVYRRPWLENLRKGRGKRSSAVEQAAETCRRHRIPVALLSNGRDWVLVHARESEPTTVAVFDADLWLEELPLLRGFATLLTATRVAAPPTDAEGRHSASLAALFARSAEAQAEVTNTLGRQVRDAVEVFVLEISRLDRESDGEVLAGVDPREVYRAALTVMMRLVFLLYAEERRLLPVDDALYRNNYAVTTLFDQLGEQQERYGEEIGDRRSAAWSRQLALFGAVHGGSRHPDLRIPAYGGSLFDPKRYRWLAKAAVTDRVVFKILDALLMLRRGTKGAERLSYKGLDVEQIGHVYEGLLEYSCKRVGEPYLGIVFGKHTAEIALADLERWAAEGTLDAELKFRTDATAKQVEKARAKRPDLSQSAYLDAACGGDQDLVARVLPWFGLLRHDLRGEPAVYAAGSVILARVGDRRSSGTHYTPRVLAEEVVQHTLAPLCYAPGPAEGAESGVWRAKTADELLRLNIVDPAMGSGAFLVAAARYVAARVVEAWIRDGIPEDVASYAGTEDRDELDLAALRMVADRCIHGVDRDEMAVELAKLSLWIVTLAKNRPFTFVDHALRSGDSLVGVLTAEQVKAFHLKPEEGRQINTEIARTLELTDELLSRAAQLRREIEEMPDLDIRDFRLKADKLARADEMTDQLRLAADAVVGAALSSEVLSEDEIEARTGEVNRGGTRAAFRAASKGAKEDAYDDRLMAIAPLIERAMDGDRDAHVEARAIVDGWLRGDKRAEPIRPLHWPLEFPELLGVGGRSFDAVVGNPPFVGGQRLTGSVGTDYREYLVNRVGGGVRGSADLCAYFLLRNLELARGRRMGIIATNTIAQGDTREVGLDQATGVGWSVYRAVKSRNWPGTAAVQVSLLWLGQPGGNEDLVLEDVPVRGITSGLDAQSRVSGRPHRLANNAREAFQGSIILGKGFVLEPAEAEFLISQDSRNKEVLFPYLNGEDLNSRSDCSASRWVINFHDWPEERAREYPAVFEIVEKKVKPIRLQVTHSAKARQRWWEYERPRPELYEAIEGADLVLVIAQTSSTQIPVLVPNRQVFDQKLVVFPSRSTAALRTSDFQYLWTVRNGSTMKKDTVFTPSDCCETLPLPTGDYEIMEKLAEKLFEFRKSIMDERSIGLTRLYNLLHGESIVSDDISRLREIHAEINSAVAAAYGWSDLDMEHARREFERGPRWSVAPTTQREALDRLLELNHLRFREEVANGLHSGSVKKKRKPTKKASVQVSVAEAPGEDLLF
ncbi:DNA methyltransferase [Embleya sp. NPDC005971]|uniref:Eco57I restriction-modification methylase domain-containing protein n=1 Tax=Embleya sp. NPDC005971 TaxID=3156724 RepID=UPI0033DCAFC5